MCGHGIYCESYQDFEILAKEMCLWKSPRDYCKVSFYKTKTHDINPRDRSEEFGLHLE